MIWQEWQEIERVEFHGLEITVERNRATGTFRLSAMVGSGSEEWLATYRLDYLGESDEERAEAFGKFWSYAYAIK